MSTYGEIRPEEDRCGVRFERLYDFSPEELWAALTEPDRLRGWLASAPRFEHAIGGTIELEFDGESGPTGGTVLVWDPPNVLEYEWRHPGESESVLRFEVVPQEAGGTLLVLDHRRLDSNAAPGYAAGWHSHLDALEQLFGSTSHDWYTRYEALRPHYEALAAGATVARST